MAAPHSRKVLRLNTSATRLTAQAADEPPDSCGEGIVRLCAKLYCGRWRPSTAAAFARPEASMARTLSLAALFLAIAVAATAQNNTIGQGIITVQGGKFVDAGCREFQFAGGNV